MCGVLGTVDGRAVVERVLNTTHLAIVKAQLERAVLNHVSNSLKFSPPGGQIEITVRGDTDDVTIAVRDTGCGIPPHEQPALFTRFFCATQTREQQAKGTGLGRYIANEIIERRGGTISVASADPTSPHETSQPGEPPIRGSSGRRGAFA